MNSRLSYIAAAGFSTAAVQIIYIREYLTIFSGNELVIGFTFAAWLLFTAIGSHVGSRLTWWNRNLVSALYVFSVLAGFLIIRASRLLFDPGEVIPPLWIPVITIVTQSDAAFFGGLVFSKMVQTTAGRNAYLVENIGALFGLFLVSFGVLLLWPTSYLLTMVLTLFSGYVLISKPDRSAGVYALVALLLIAVFFKVDPVSMQWKYGKAVQSVSNGHLGEIAVSRGEGDTLTYINNTLYKLKMPLPSIEQAVHIPFAMKRKKPGNVLVLGNAGQIAELEKYQNVIVECREIEPQLVDSICRYGDIRDLPAEARFDLILTAVSLPGTAQSCRFFTREFFEKMRDLAGESGIYSFTLPFGENFLSPDEKKLKDLIQTTLGSIFKNVFVFPGSGYTFVASDDTLVWPALITIRSDYLEPFILPAVSKQRILMANNRLDSVSLNLVKQPVALYLAQKQWLGIFGLPLLLVLAMLGLMAVIGLFLSPRTFAAFSVGSSGFVTGLYSISLMMLFQFIHGSLYANIALLMIGLLAGFVAGAFIRHFPVSDLVVGIYASITLAGLSTVNDPPMMLFVIFHAGIGFLSAAQFVTRKGTAWHGLYNADLAGGLIGMGICSTILYPVAGIWSIAGIILILKVISAIITAKHDT